MNNTNIDKAYILYHELRQTASDNAIKKASLMQVKRPNLQAIKLCQKTFQNFTKDLETNISDRILTALFLEGSITYFHVELMEKILKIFQEKKPD